MIVDLDSDVKSIVNFHNAKRVNVSVVVFTDDLNPVFTMQGLGKREDSATLYGLSLVIGQPRGMGMGTRACAALITTIFDLNPQIETLSLTVNRFNTRAIKMYKKLGFSRNTEHEGAKINYYNKNSIPMYLSRKDFERGEQV